MQLLKTVGWRVVAATGVLYGALYAYERATWTQKAQERVFKRQYVNHASKKLRLIVDLTSANCSHQVQQSVSSLLTHILYHGVRLAVCLASTRSRPGRGSLLLIVFTPD